MNILNEEKIESLEKITQNLKLELPSKQLIIPDEKLKSLKKANSILGLDTIKQDKIIIVYCPPRVGSTSLVLR